MNDSLISHNGRRIGWDISIKSRGNPNYMVPFPNLYSATILETMSDALVTEKEEEKDGDEWSNRDWASLKCS